jgi:hypothetical protein
MRKLLLTLVVICASMTTSLPAELDKETGHELMAYFLKRADEVESKIQKMKDLGHSDGQIRFHEGLKEGYWKAYLDVKLYWLGEWPKETK